MFKFLKTKSSAEEQAKKIFLKQQIALIERLQEEISNLEGAIKEVEAEQGHNPNGFAIMNALLFFRLSFLDIVILTKQFLEVKKDFEKLVLAKQLCLLVYELLEDLPAVFGKEYKTALSELSDNVDLIEGHKKLQVSINSFKKEVAKELKQIRNFTAAHKEHNSLKQLEVIKTISTERIEIISLGVLGIFIELHMYEKILRARAKGIN